MTSLGDVLANTYLAQQREKMKLHPEQDLSQYRWMGEALKALRPSARKLAHYVCQNAVWTVEADEDMGILNTYSQCEECDQVGPTPGTIVHKDGCIVKLALATINTASVCMTCCGVGSVRIEHPSHVSMGCMRCCDDCHTTGVKASE